MARMMIDRQMAVNTALQRMMQQRKNGGSSDAGNNRGRSARPPVGEQGSKRASSKWVPHPPSAQGHYEHDDFRRQKGVWHASRARHAWNPKWDKTELYPNGDRPLFTQYQPEFDRIAGELRRTKAPKDRPNSTKPGYDSYGRQLTKGITGASSRAAYQKTVNNRNTPGAPTGYLHDYTPYPPAKKQQQRSRYR